MSFLSAVSRSLFSDSIPGAQHHASAKDLFICSGCEGVCDVYDISSTVLYDLLYHRAFELSPAVNK